MPTSSLRIQSSLVIRATPERVWRALTDPELTSRYYYGSRVQSTFAPGASIAYLAPDGTPLVEGEVMSAEAPRRLVTRTRALWDPATAIDAPTRVEWEIHAHARGAEVTVTQDGFERETETYRQSVEGWAPVLAGLGALLESDATGAKGGL